MAAEYEVGYGHWKGDPIGNIRVLKERDTRGAALPYLVKNDDGTWSWCGDETGSRSRGWDLEFEVARGLGAERMTVVAIEQPKLGKLLSEPSPFTDEAVSERVRILREAEKIITKDRNGSYGDPEDNFQRIADLWNVFLGDRMKDGQALTPGDTAALMILVKMAREMNAPHPDNKTDIIGYAACWAQVDKP